MILSSLFLAGICATSNVIAAATSKEPPRFVKGKAFDRFVTIWLENTDFDDALADPSLSALAKQGIELNNYFALTHPSEPNYVASVGGEYFGMDNDNLNRIPENISSIVDLLEEKGISWGEYQQDMPETGFQGFSFNNPVTGAGDYVRKHNPLIIFDSVANSPARSSNIKNFTLFNEDLAKNKLPQWMFITPNLTSDGHDTNVTVAGTFTKGFLEPLLKNKNFNGDRTLVLITFDENENHLQGNRVRSILLGSAVPKNLIGTSDNYYYDHYSEISTMQANWGLSTLGRYDVGANVFDMVAKHTGDRLRNADLDATFLNGSYPGLFNSVKKAPLPIPNTKLVINGRRVLKKVVDTWGAPALQKCTLYTGSLQIPSAGQPPVLPAGC